jgi:hypothetical protein
LANQQADTEEKGAAAEKQDDDSDENEYDCPCCGGARAAVTIPNFGFACIECATSATLPPPPSLFASAGAVIVAALTVATTQPSTDATDPRDFFDSASTADAKRKEDEAQLQNVEWLATMGFSKKMSLEALKRMGNAEESGEARRNAVLEYLLLLGDGDADLSVGAGLTERELRIQASAAALATQGNGAAETADTLLGIIEQVRLTVLRFLDLLQNCICQRAHAMFYNCADYSRSGRIEVETCARSEQKVRYVRHSYGFYNV